MRFEAVADSLLKGGVAPRHVRRYVRELDEHLDDLTAQQRASGYDGEDAALRARARLGDDAELTQAMLEQPGMKSWAARLPWLVFVALPPVLSAVVGLRCMPLSISSATRPRRSMPWCPCRGLCWSAFRWRR